MINDDLTDNTIGRFGGGAYMMGAAPGTGVMRTAAGGNPFAMAEPRFGTPRSGSKNAASREKYTGKVPNGVSRSIASTLSPGAIGPATGGIGSMSPTPG